MADTTWLSAYLFWNGPLDELLLRCVAPLVQYGQRQGWVRQFFFIRYAEGGPHIRLRLRAASTTAHAHLARLVARRFNQFSQAAGGEDGRIYFAPYEPETARYGGPQSLPLAEAFFEASSGVVLRWLRTQGGSPTPASRLTAALALHAQFAGACWLPAQAVAHLRRYTAAWLPHDPAGGPVAAERAYWLNLFASYSQRQRPALQAMLAEPAPTCGWLAAYAAASRVLSGQPALLALAPDQLSELQASLLHMTNNRLGIANHDEAFIAYLLAEALPTHLAAPA